MLRAPKRQLWWQRAKEQSCEGLKASTLTDKLPVTHQEMI